jgi:hypothetical protein
MGRPPIGDRAMTATERQRARRVRKEAEAKAPPVSPPPVPPSRHNANRPLSEYIEDEPSQPPLPAPPQQPAEPKAAPAPTPSAMAPPQPPETSAATAPPSHEEPETETEALRCVFCDHEQSSDRFLIRVRTRDSAIDVCEVCIKGRAKAAREERRRRLEADLTENSEAAQLAIDRARAAKTKLAELDAEA